MVKVRESGGFMPWVPMPSNVEPWPWDPAVSPSGYVDLRSALLDIDTEPPWNEVSLEEIRRKTGCGWTCLFAFGEVSGSIHTLLYCHCG